jgi:hypothetical protein
MYTYIYDAHDISFSVSSIPMLEGQLLESVYDEVYKCIYIYLFICVVYVCKVFIHSIFCEFYTYVGRSGVKECI